MGMSMLLWYVLYERFQRKRKPKRRLGQELSRKRSRGQPAIKHHQQLKNRAWFAVMPVAGGAVR